MCYYPSLESQLLEDTILVCDEAAVDYVDPHPK